MPKFLMIADCEFDADDLDDAFLKLSKHFDSLASDEDDDDPELITNGVIEIEIVK